MKTICCLLFSLLANIGVAQDQWKNVYKESAWKERDTWQRPEDLIKRMNIKDGSTVADIGCNEGYMTLKLSGVVGEKGKVYAVDVDQSKLTRITEHLESQNVHNVSLVKGDYDDPKLPPNALDAVIILDTYHEMVDHDKILQHVKSALKTGGRLLLCEPIAESRRGLSRAEQEKKHELEMAFALSDLATAGYEITFQKDFFVDRTKVKGDVMWLVVATKK